MLGDEVSPEIRDPQLLPQADALVCLQDFDGPLGDAEKVPEGSDPLYLGAGLLDLDTPNLYASPYTSEIDRYGYDGVIPTTWARQDMHVPFGVVMREILKLRERLNIRTILASQRMLYPLYIEANKVISAIANEVPADSPDCAVVFAPQWPAQQILPTAARFVYLINASRDVYFIFDGKSYRFDKEITGMFRDVLRQFDIDASALAGDNATVLAHSPSRSQLESLARLWQKVSEHDEKESLLCSEIIKGFIKIFPESAAKIVADTEELMERIRHPIPGGAVETLLRQQGFLYADGSPNFSEIKRWFEKTIFAAAACDLGYSANQVLLHDNDKSFRAAIESYEWPLQSGKSACFMWSSDGRSYDVKKDIAEVVDFFVVARRGYRVAPNDIDFYQALNFPDRNAAFDFLRERLEQIGAQLRSVLIESLSLGKKYNADLIDFLRSKKLIPAGLTSGELITAAAVELAQQQNILEAYLEYEVKQTKRPSMMFIAIVQSLLPHLQLTIWDVKSKDERIEAVSVSPSGSWVAKPIDLLLYGASGFRQLSFKGYAPGIFPVVTEPMYPAKKALCSVEEFLCLIEQLNFPIQVKLDIYAHLAIYKRYLQQQAEVRPQLQRTIMIFQASYIFIRETLLLYLPKSETAYVAEVKQRLVNGDFDLRDDLNILLDKILQARHASPSFAMSLVLSLTDLPLEAREVFFNNKILLQALRDGLFQSRAEDENDLTKKLVRLNNAVDRLAEEQFPGLVQRLKLLEHYRDTLLAAAGSSALRILKKQMNGLQPSKEDLENWRKLCELISPKVFDALCAWFDERKIAIDDAAEDQQPIAAFLLVCQSKGWDVAELVSAKLKKIASKEIANVDLGRKSDSFRLMQQHLLGGNFQLYKARIREGLAQAMMRVLPLLKKPQVAAGVYVLDPRHMAEIFLALLECLKDIPTELLQGFGFWAEAFKSDVPLPELPLANLYNICGGTAAGEVWGEQVSPATVASVGNNLLIQPLLALFTFKLGGLGVVKAGHSNPSHAMFFYLLSHAEWRERVIKILAALHNQLTQQDNEAWIREKIEGFFAVAEQALDLPDMPSDFAHRIFSAHIIEMVDVPAGLPSSIMDYLRAAKKAIDINEAYCINVFRRAKGHAGVSNESECQAKLRLATEECGVVYQAEKTAKEELQRLRQKRLSQVFSPRLPVRDSVGVLDGAADELPATIIQAERVMQACIAARKNAQQKLSLLEFLADIDISTVQEILLFIRNNIFESYNDQLAEMKPFHLALMDSDLYSLVESTQQLITELSQDNPEVFQQIVTMLENKSILSDAARGFFFNFSEVREQIYNVRQKKLQEVGQDTAAFSLYSRLTFVGKLINYWVGKEKQIAAEEAGKLAFIRERIAKLKEERTSLEARLKKSSLHVSRIVDPFLLHYMLHEGPTEDEIYNFLKLCLVNNWEIPKEFEDYLQALNLQMVPESIRAFFAMLPDLNDQTRIAITEFFRDYAKFAGIDEETCKEYFLNTLTGSQKDAREMRLFFHLAEQNSWNITEAVKEKLKSVVTEAVAKRPTTYLREPQSEAVSLLLIEYLVSSVKDSYMQAAAAVFQRHLEVAAPACAESCFAGETPYDDRKVAEFLFAVLKDLAQLEIPESLCEVFRLVLSIFKEKSPNVELLLSAFFNHFLGSSFERIYALQFEAQLPKPDGLAFFVNSLSSLFSMASLEVTQFKRTMIVALFAAHPEEAQSLVISLFQKIFAADYSERLRSKMKPYVQGCEAYAAYRKARVTMEDEFFHSKVEVQDFCQAKRDALQACLEKLEKAYPAAAFAAQLQKQEAQLEILRQRIRDYAARSDEPARVALAKAYEAQAKVFNNLAIIQLVFAARKKIEKSIVRLQSVFASVPETLRQAICIKQKLTTVVADLKSQMGHCADQALQAFSAVQNEVIASGGLKELDRSLRLRNIIRQAIINYLLALMGRAADTPYQLPLLEKINLVYLWRACENNKMTHSPLQLVALAMQVSENFKLFFLFQNKGMQREEQTAADILRMFNFWQEGDEREDLPARLVRAKQELEAACDVQDTDRCHFFAKQRSQKWQSMNEQKATQGIKDIIDDERFPSVARAGV